jgi:drug/metabolite transporter (DMT)-like permease
MITRLPLAALITASLFWGTAVSVTKYALGGFGPITLLAISLIAGTAVLWTIVILRGRRPPPPWRRAALLGLLEPALAYAGDLHVAARFWLAANFVGVIGYAASFLLYNYAIARVRAAPASIILNLIPVFGLASAVLWLGDSLTIARILGAILIGLSVTIFTAAELAEARNAAKANATPSKA